MNEGRPGAVITADRVYLTDEAVRVGAPVPEEPHGEPRIQVVREDGMVRVIEVTCTCGEQIRIQCMYT